MAELGPLAYLKTGATLTMLTIKNKYVYEDSAVSYNDQEESAKISGMDFTLALEGGI